ncbi:Methyl-accepting chemotaxis protein [Marinobacter nitratireducens]|uniref:Methyl-accepting chemotaxis protein n=1 Tax=Marinobacter nitratireducens TaxID=1137280 RepID=A0A072NA90_9GAMM|nr:methyl-accepting chemotaxis protein [Marinobacter nitratireducens]KEF29970.1 Methyl-accepting chemotaxis protein [Marinobacter nitratireducens]
MLSPAHFFSAFTLTIGHKLAIGFAILITLAVATGIIGATALDRYGQSADRIVLTSKLESGFLKARAEETKFLLHKDPAYVDQATERLDQVVATADKLLTMIPSERASAVDTIKADAGRYASLLQQVAATLSETTLATEQLTMEGRVLEAHMNNESRLYLATAMFKQMRREERNFLISREEKSIHQFDDRLDRTLASIRSSSLNTSEKEEVSSLFNSYAAAFHTTAGKIQQTAELESTMEATAMAGLQAASKLQSNQAARMVDEQQRATLAISVATGVSILIGVALSLLLTRLIVRPIREAVGAARKVAEGDLRDSITSKRADESGQLLNALGEMIVNLRNLVNQIDGNARDIAASSSQLTAVTTQNSRGVTEQRDQTDQVATAMNEMVATVGEVARNAEAASSAASDASAKARVGEQAVEQTLSRVTDLNQQVSTVQERLHGLQSDTRNIGTVLDVIKSVAEQTNLLALNAAIEAARAGEQGRGFAVVADEVRSLAQRTQGSASEIEELISRLVNSAEETVSVMEAGAQLADETLTTAHNTGSAIQEITRAVDNIHRLNQQIATAAEQQTSVAEDINQNLTRIRDVSDSTASSTEQVSSASTELANLGDSLRTQVARFAV